MFETLGQYKILERVGAGSTGDVFRARDTRSGRTVAITVIGPAIAANAERRAQFLTDARTAASLSHPNIAVVYEVGEDQGHLFLVCEFVPGETLKNSIAGRPLNPRRVVDLGIQIADAIADAHAAGLLHRDLGCNTVIVTPKGNAKVLDFGLARWTAGDPTVYSAPEEAPGHPVDYRTDIFSVGVVMFEMLTGRLPFAASSAAATTPAPAVVPAPSSINRSLPPEFDPIVSRAMAMSVDDRYQSAATLAAELRAVGAVLDARSEAQEAAASATPAPQRGGGSAGIWFVLLVVAAALAAAAWYERDAIERAWHQAFGQASAAWRRPLLLQQGDEAGAVDVRARHDDADAAVADVDAASD